MRGVFEGPGTSSPVPDEVAGIRLTGLVRAHLAGERDTAEDEDEDEESMEGEEGFLGGHD